MVVEHTPILEPPFYCYDHCIEVEHLSQLLRHCIPTALYLIGSLFTLVSLPDSPQCAFPTWYSAGTG